MPARFFLRLLLLLLLGASAWTQAGCIGARESSGDGDAGPARATIRVDNQRSVDAVVYAVRAAGQRQRLGRVNAYSEEVLELPRNLVSGNGVPLRFQAEMLGVDRPPVSREVVVYPGDEVGLTLPPF